MNRLAAGLGKYAGAVHRLSNGKTTGPGYAQAVSALLGELLAARDLPFQPRARPGAQGNGGCPDQSDFALHDGPNNPVVLGKLAPPGVDLGALALSTDHDDEIGCLLAKAQVVLLCNGRGFGLLTARPDADITRPVTPEQRSLQSIVNLWPSISALQQGASIASRMGEALADLLECAVTQHARISEPESLARILARFARAAKARLPARCSATVRGLVDDLEKLLGISFHGPKGELFLRSSLVQTAFYGLFAAWCVWHRHYRTRAFRWDEISCYLQVSFLTGLFQEIRRPKRLKELALAEYLQHATQALLRVDEKLFFSRFRLASIDPSGIPKTGDQPNAIECFYEPFLESFDQDLRNAMSVWYTPPDLARYQVRRIHNLLREELGCVRGLADENVVVLDPCCGTGTYLIEVLQCIADELVEEGQEAALGTKLEEALRSRVIGFETHLAPFVIARLQAHILLANLRGSPPDVDRPAIFLANALSPRKDLEGAALNFPEFQEDCDPTHRVNLAGKILVVLGNPPYNRIDGVTVRERLDLLDQYKGIVRETNGTQVEPTLLSSRWGAHSHFLDGQHLGFVRLAEERIGQEADCGIASFVTNSSYLTGRSYPMMRESLLNTYQDIWVDNLHGNRLANQRTPWGGSCETIFYTPRAGPAIRVGTCVSTFLKRRSRSGSATAHLHLRDFWGSAEEKRTALLSSVYSDDGGSARGDHVAAPRKRPQPYVDVSASPSRRWRFAAHAGSAEFEEWPALEELFPISIVGVQTGKDAAVVALSRAALIERFHFYLDPRRSDDEVRSRWPELLERAKDFDDPTAFRRAMLFDPNSRDADATVLPYSYRPMDLRAIWYETKRRTFRTANGAGWSGSLVQRYREGFKAALHFENEFLCAVPQPRRTSESRPMLSKNMVDLHFHDCGTTCFPAKGVTLPNDAEGDDSGPSDEAVAKANLAPEVWNVLRTAWQLKGGVEDKPAFNLVRLIFRASMAIMHAPKYEAEHAESLAQDWARVPIPRTMPLFRKAAALGDQVTCLLDPARDAHSALRAVLGKAVETIAVAQTGTGGPIRSGELVIRYSYSGAGKGKWRGRSPANKECWHPALGSSTGDLWLNEHMSLRHVPRAVWQYELGGYPVIKKWLGYRECRHRDGQGLSPAELDHLSGMVRRIAALLALRPQLDDLYDQVREDAFTSEELGLAGSLGHLSSSMTSVMNRSHRKPRTSTPAHVSPGSVRRTKRSK